MSLLSVEFTDLVGQALGFQPGFLDWHFKENPGFESIQEGGRIKVEIRGGLVDTT